MAEKLYADVTGIANPIAINLSTGHSYSTATANVHCKTASIGIGDQMIIDMGYETNHAKVFQGYVKSITREIPDDTYKIVAKDDLIRAVDFFVVPTNPEDSFKRTNIDAEDLVEQVLALAGLTNFTFTPTSFTFATRDETEVEVKLTSAYDFCKMIADLLTWHLYSDEDGLIHFINRKPHVMDGTSGQPGDIADVAINLGNPITDSTILNFTYNESDRDLRNRVVVHGSEGVYAEALASSPYLPAGFYKSMALVSPIIDDDGMAQNAANYNLQLYNKLTVASSMVVIGDPTYLARRVIEINEAITNTTGDWYIYLAEHNWSKEGYVVNMELRI